MWFALTDFLVVIGVAIAVWRMRPVLEQNYPRLVAAGLAFFAIAALIGTVRFASGEVDALARWHSVASSTAGIWGVLLIFQGQRGPVALSSSGFLILTIIIVLALLTDVELAWLGYLCVAAGTSLALVQTFSSVDYRPHVLWLASWMLLIFASLAIGASREITTLGIAHWHIYHALLGVWAVLVGEAARAAYRQPEPARNPPRR